MEIPDRMNTAPGESYPSPNASQIGAGTTPFYHPGQHSLPLTEQLNSSAHTQHGTPAVRHINKQGPSHTFMSHHASGDSQGPREQYMGVPQQIAQGILSATELEHPDQPNREPGEEPLQKRSKLSRACDECRRKKVRCDAKSENSGEQCSSCKRLNQHCQFSRLALKRGPSKGYIKELAERVGKLEYIAQVPDVQLATSTPPDGSISQGMLPFSPNPNGIEQPPRKGTQSVSSGAPYTESIEPLYQETSAQAMSRFTPNNSAPDGLGQPVPRTPGYPYQNVVSLLASDVNQVGYAAPIASPDASFNGQHHSFDRAERSVPVVPRQDSKKDDRIEWDAQCIEEYYRLIHPTAPFLPTGKTQLQQYVTSHSPAVRDAVLQALYTAVYSSPTMRYRGDDGDQLLERSFQVASQLIARLRDQDAPTPNRSNKLAILQATILMMFATEFVGPRNSKLFQSSDKSFWLSMAVGVAYDLDLHLNKPHEAGSEQGLARSAWLILNVLDKWNSAGTSSPVRIENKRITLHSTDRVLVGETCFHLTRLSIILGHVSDLCLAPVSLSPPDTFPHNHVLLISEILNGEFDRFRESTFDIIKTTPSLGLAYWHVKLLFNRHNRLYISETNDVVGIAFKIVQQLRRADNPPSPMIHHFAALAALTLTEYISTKETQDDALIGLHSLKEALDSGRVFREDQIQSTKGWRTAISDFIIRKLHSASQRQSEDMVVDHGGLQHLADLAVEKSNGYDAQRHAEDRQGTATNEETDGKIPTKRGYLNACG